MAGMDGEEEEEESLFAPHKPPEPTGPPKAPKTLPAHAIPKLPPPPGTNPKPAAADPVVPARAETSSSIMDEFDAFAAELGADPNFSGLLDPAPASTAAPVAVPMMSGFDIPAAPTSTSSVVPALDDLPALDPPSGEEVQGEPEGGGEEEEGGAGVSGEPAAGEAQGAESSAGNKKKKKKKKNK